MNTYIEKGEYAKCQHDFYGSFLRRATFFSPVSPLMNSSDWKSEPNIHYLIGSLEKVMCSFRNFHILSMGFYSFPHLSDFHFRTLPFFFLFHELIIFNLHVNILLTCHGDSHLSTKYSIKLLIVLDLRSSYNF